MIRFTLLVILRSLLLFAVVYGLYRLVRKTVVGFFEGFRDQKPVEPGTPPVANDRPKVEYRDVQDAKFEEEKKAP
jgi:hypothetical protein